MAQRFYKYEGTANDFVVLEMMPNPDIVPLVCDRRRGVGADGVLFVSEIDPDTQTARMVVINRDGSRPEMCGNGVRCVARYLVEHHSFSNALTIVSDAGDRPCEVNSGSDMTVSVEMGPATVDGELAVTFDGVEYQLISVNVGNPHAVAFVDTFDHVEAFGRKLNERRVEFPNGVNLEFAIVDGNAAEVRVYERGVGLTHACGTGACAVAAAGWAKHVFALGPTVINLPGGPLTIQPSDHGVLMTGGVEATFSGTFSTSISKRFAKEA